MRHDLHYARPIIQQPTVACYSRLLHAAAWLTALATFPLIWMGGLVTSHGAGLSVPDWPNSFGYNMFALPFNKWLGTYAGGVFYEHTHRLLGSLVGLCAIALTFVAWRIERRPWVRWVASGVLAAVIVQGLMGGFRVTEGSNLLAAMHGVFGQCVFALAAVVCVVTSRWWIDRRPDPRGTLSKPVVWASAALVGLILMQLTLGAMMRHDPRRSPIAMTGAGLAIPDVPLSYGKLLPPVSAAGLERANQIRAFQLDMPPVDLGQIWLNFAHRCGAVLVSLATLLAAYLAFSKMLNEPKVWRIALLLPVILVGQITLGVLTILWRKPADIATAHQALGALFLVAAVVLLTRVARASSTVAAWHGRPARVAGLKSQMGESEISVEDTRGTPMPQELVAG